MQGFADHSFRPNQPISRAQTVLILARSMGWTIITPATPTFLDVGTEHFAYSAVETAYHHGVVSGFSPGLFAPNTNTTRGQLAKMLYQAISH